MTAQRLPGAAQLPAHDPQLALAGLSRDRTHLLLVSRTGARFTLPLDARLAAAVGGDTTSTGQLEITMDSTIRPRDIQARIRAGATPESLAEAASTSLDKIMPYAAPVLAEREHVTQRAQRSSLRRPGHAARTLGDAVAAHLRGLGADPAALAWDAWRRDDGRWTVVADTAATEDTGGRAGTATFTFDAPGNFVVLEDDHAHWLVGAEPERAPEPTGQPTGQPGGRPLAAVPAEEAWEQPVEAFLDERPGLDERPQRAAAADAAALDRTGADARRPVEDESGDVALELDLTPSQPREPHDDAPTEAPAAAEEPPARRSSRKKGRASVPSWDEIMFGGGGGS